ncbi:unnamed protein product [Cuscuta epithymum]|uniref:F-box domain-containing protein n=1 Tax=Cuscuta epithymum TaxID=186058 RepID=A0AAV0DES2_9ASTE|nr:unnamed protein product [Cuscuta epithymum]CAH9143875.1 unnamed protein product [Cuscuta epithymum]
MRKQPNQPCLQDHERLVDRISSLPDHVLAKILSLVPLEDAGRTSILSPRWRYIWTSVTNFDFFFADDKVGGLERFATMVDHVLAKCNSMNVDSFSLFCPEIKDLSRVNDWVSSGVRLKPKSLVLKTGSGILDDYGLVCLPPYPKCTITYCSMVALELESCFDIEIPDSIVSFPCLKTLTFTGWFPYHCHVMDKLTSSCPVLEKLHLEGFLEPNADLMFDISIPTLKAMHLEFFTDESGLHEHYIIIDAPKLEDLYIDDHTEACYYGRNLDSLISVHVDVDYEGSLVGDANFERLKRLLMLFASVSKAKRLTLSAASCSSLKSAMGCRPFPTFPSLVDLDFESPHPYDLTLLAHFLQNSPNLERLSLHKVFTRDVEEQSIWNPLKDLLDCLKLNLKQVEFPCFRGRKDEFELVEYFLGNAEALEMVLVTTSPDPFEDEMAEKIEAFDRASQACEVYVGYI